MKKGFAITLGLGLALAGSLPLSGMPPRQHRLKGTVLSVDCCNQQLRMKVEGQPDLRVTLKDSTTFWVGARQVGPCAIREQSAVTLRFRREAGQMIAREVRVPALKEAR
jgi:hypothetical protein